jgi:hypothetical protein
MVPSQRDLQCLAGVLRPGGNDNGLRHAAHPSSQSERQTICTIVRKT